ncbi:uncharacterized protein LOC103831388 isoform X2 [Brassica rapa]|uniref:uncharacterized protein LOC103831388 isoform X2 n=1 Tax=Brassica campestris TaxID=3711 RepID=UPI00142E319B|nr:uncharacterized protein LOC103831388 isoform X2 [Brassica rapa]
MKITLIILRVAHLLTLIAFAHSDYYIESSDGGLVKCVDRKEQPAFDNSLLRNHKFQESPSKIPTTTTKSNTNSKWRTTEAHVSIAKCPRGTVPMRQDDASEYPGNNTSTQTTHESDAYQTTGCYNLRCPGFVQTSRSVVLGGAISPVSIFGSKQYEITVHVWKDQKQGNWWLSLGADNLIIGYWPSELFTNLDYANEVHWGGEVVDSHSFGRHTKTQMGSGRFPFEGFGKASYFRNLEIVDSNNFQPIQRLKTNAEKEYYDIKNLDIDEEWGTHFFYGGPGFSTHTHSGVVPLTVRLIFICFSLNFFIII